MRDARAIVQFECDKEGVTVEELWNSGKTKTIAHLRRTIIKRLRDETRLSWREIGGLVGLNSKPNKQYASVAGD
jgi:chromosomal replication initiation ATPase DnaA